MDDYTDFWERPSRWPDDLHGYTFLARAFNRLGQAMYPEWNGSEGVWAVTYCGPTSVMLNAELSRVGDDAEAVAKVKSDYAAYEAAYERGIAVQRRLAVLAEAGDLITGLAPRNGGSIENIRPGSGRWNLQPASYLARFGLGMMSRERPFSPPSSYRPSLPISGEFHWVYVETASLDRVLAPPSAATTEAPVEPSPQTEPSAGATGAPKQNLTAGPGKQRRKGPGPRPRYEWPRIEKKAFELLDHYGGISPDEPELPSQEALVTKLLQFCGSEFGREPVPSTMRTYVTKWIEEYEGGKRSA